MDSNLTVEELMALMIVKFEKYTHKCGGDGKTLNTDQLYELATEEFPTICGAAKKDEILTEIISKMDTNDDQKVTFDEFMSFSSCVAASIREILNE